MSIIYSIRNTANTETIVVRPGTRNGPDGAIKDSDINLHGMGSIAWGEEMGENFIRLTENFACPESTGTPGFPQTSTDLGEGYGINNPVQGQLWFNTTSQSLMVYDGTIWKQSGGLAYGASEPSTNPADGDLWFDTQFFGSPAGPGQLMIYNDGAWESVAEQYLPITGGTLTGYLTLAGPPVNPLHAATMDYVDTTVGDFLPLTGGTMTGVDTKITFAQLIIGGHDGDITEGPDIEMAAQGLIAADSNLRIHVESDGLGTGNFIVSKGSKFVDGLGSQTDLFQIASTNGMLREMTTASTYAAAVSDDRDIPNKKYVDDTVTGTIGLSTGADRVVSFFSGTGGTPQTGDIRVQGGIIYIRESGVWRQVYPAVYS